MIPECLTLRDDQKQLLHSWVKAVMEIDPPSEYDVEEDVSMASPVTFSIYSTGIGDSILAGYRGHCLHLGLDDDGELLTHLDFKLDSDVEIIKS